MTRPVVALTMGDPAGVGPEIILKTLRRKSLLRKVKLVIVGDKFVLENTRRFCRITVDLPAISNFADLSKSKRFPCLLDRRHRPFEIPMGHVDARCGRLSLDYLRTAVRLTRQGLAQGIVTAPISKLAWARAGSKFRGHTELLARLHRIRSFAMAFYAKNFLTVLLTTHIPLKEAIASISPISLRRTIQLTASFLEQIGRPRARIAVAGLNPHAGESGLLGQEERFVFAPAIKRCRKEGLLVSGPYPADTIYLRAARGEFDAVISPYHDQAMLAVKTLSFGRATNITLGLPCVRTSVDHGTAFDIAGRAVADESALVEAIERCRDVILAREKFHRRKS